MKNLAQNIRAILGRDEQKSEQGVILVGVLITMLFFMMVGLAISEFSINHYHSARRSLITLDALTAAEAGGDFFMHELNKTGSTYTGTGGEYTFFNDSIQGKGTYQTSIANGSIANEKIITSTGRIYQPSTASTPTVSRRIRLIIVQSVSVGYSVQSGPGGLFIGNNTILTAGPIYVGGKLSMSNNSNIGTSSKVVDVYAEDVDCPTGGGSSYPVQCTSKPPYTISTSNNAHIYGNVYAKNDVDVPSRVTGTISSTVPHVDFPIIDHNTVTSAHGWTSRSDNGSCSNGTSWAANVHFNGNVSLGNNCSITVNGDVWIDGTLTLGNNATLVVGSGLTVQPKIIIDGYNGGSFITGNNASLTANATSVGFQVLAYYSFNPAGNGPSGCNPGCGSLNGPELYTSQSKTTITLGNNFSAAVGTLFYTRWTDLTVSNNTTVGQLMGQSLHLSNNGNLVFNNGSGGGGATSWDVKYWEQLFQ